MTLTCKLLIYLALTLCVVSGAKAYEVEEDTGVICDTQAQVERYVRLGQNPQAITIINHDQKVCLMVNVRFIRGGESTASMRATKLCR